MNWYKAATETTVPVTPEGFGAMSLEEKGVLARDPSISLLTQQLFFTEEYKRKEWILAYLAKNPSIHPELQPLFFAEPDLWKNRVLRNLALNPNITSETQRLFLTETYKWKNETLWYLEQNESFLRDFTPDEWLKMKNLVRGRAKLHVLSKRLEQLKEIP